MKLRYLTEYTVGPTKFGGDIWATDWAHAKRLARKRKIGEKVIGKGMRTGGLKRPRTRLEKLHEATYLSWIGMEMGKLTPQEVLGDKGLIHEMVHNLNGMKINTEKRFRELQRMIPGHLK